MRNSQLNFLKRTKATAASSAPSESEKSVIQTRPNPVDHTTAQSSARSMSWELRIHYPRHLHYYCDREDPYSLERVQTIGVTTNWELNTRLNRSQRTGNLTAR